jgi:hypothetical protein
MLPEPLGPAPTSQRCQESKRDIGRVGEEGKHGEKRAATPADTFTIERYEKNLSDLLQRVATAENANKLLY